MISIPTISTLAGMRQYILTGLGSGVICIEMTTEQLDQTIYDSLQETYRYLYGEAVYQDFLAFKLQPNTSAYTLSDNIQDVFDFESVDYRINTHSLLFNPSFNLVSDDIFGMGVGYNNSLNGNTGSGFYAEDSGQGLVLAGITLQLMYLDEINLALGTKYRVEYRELENQLIILPTVKTEGWGILRIWRRVSIEKMFNHILFKRLATANAGLQWASHLKKYSVQLPGGGTINSDVIYQDYLMKRNEALDSIKSEAQPPEFFIG